MSVLAPPRPAPPPPPPSRLPPDPKWWARLPWRSPEAKAAPRDDLATFCIFLVTLAVALSLGRLFRGSAWLPYAVGSAVLGHLLAWGLRRLGAGLTVASVASPVFSLLVAMELVVPQATTFGLPTPYTFQVMGQALTDAQSAFRTAVPPVAPAPGFLAAAVVGVCMVAFLADWAAFRMRTSFEACAPGLGLFVFTSALGAKSHRGLAVAAFAAATLVFLIVQRANLDGSRTAWFGGRARGALPSLLATGAVLGSVALVGALVVGPKVPGASSKPLLSFKKSSGGTGTSNRSTVSPLVDIQTRLRTYDNVDVFTVKSPRPSYWRLTSLDQFNGTIWSSNERYAATRGELGRAEPGAPAGSPLVQEVTVSGLASIWLPAAYRPTKVEGVSGLSYSPGSASLISKRDTTDGLTYTITSEVSTLTPALLRKAPPSAPGRSGLQEDLERYTKVNGPITARVRQLASQLSERDPTPYGKAMAIQDYLRSNRFTYSLSAPAGHSGNAVDRFLFVTRVGYCEQFAGSYALLARLMGLPARVAVGFQPGAPRGDTFAVQDKDAHAWPEVYLEGIGWTAFEPTPSLGGNPQAESYTGVPYTPAPPGGPDPANPAPAPAPAPAPGETTVPTTVAPGDTPAGDPTAPEPGQESNPLAGFLAFLRAIAPFLFVLALLGGVVGGLAALVAWDRRSRRRLAGGTTEGRVHHAWQEALQAISRNGLRARSGETVDELLHRLSLPASGAALAGVERGTPGHDALLRLGAAVVQTAYTGRNAATTLAEAAEADRDTVLEASRGCLSRRDRLKVDLDPRPALARLRASRRRRHPPPDITPA